LLAQIESAAASARALAQDGCKMDVVRAGLDDAAADVRLRLVAYGPAPREPARTAQPPAKSDAARPGRSYAPARGFCGLPFRRQRPAKPVQCLRRATAVANRKS
jgi:hypothetical protein